MTRSKRIPPISVVPGVTVHALTRDEETAHDVARAAGETLGLARDLWGLSAPEDCRIQVMDSWRDFLFSMAPFFWRPLLGLTFPLWQAKVRRTWRFAGGWAQAFGRRRCVGVKPPRLLKETDRSLGATLFVPEASPAERVRFITGHELIHALSDHLKLPVWLHEGLAMVTVDRLLDKETVLRATLDRLDTAEGGAGRRDYDVAAGDAMVTLYAKGYWWTRYLAEAEGDRLRALLTRRRARGVLERELAAALKMEENGLHTGLSDRARALFAE